MTNNNQKKIISTDPIKQVILNDEVLDLVLKEVIKDPAYIEVFSDYDSGKISKEEFTNIFNELILKHRNNII